MNEEEYTEEDAIRDRFYEDVVEAINRTTGGGTTPRNRELVDMLWHSLERKEG